MTIARDETCVAVESGSSIGMVVSGGDFGSVEESVMCDTDPKRVKVYILENNEWKDTGTGFCIGKFVEEKLVSEDGNEETMTHSAYMMVTNEDVPGSLLLKSKLEGNIEYQRQEETLIVWKDLSGCDIALSFEESIGCDSLCEFIVQVQKSVESNISLVAVKTSVNGMSSIHEMITGPVPLPSNEAYQDEAMLYESLRILNENTAFEFLKNQTIEFVLQSHYIETLINHFHEAERERLPKNLFLLSNILKTLILYNQRDILEQLVEDRYVEGVVGILEYDTEFPTSKANHRKYLEASGPTFKEVIPWENEELKIVIKKCFRLYFLKDVVLVRFLDDHNLDLILDVILDLETCIIDFLQEDSFISKLVELYTTESIKNNNTKADQEKRKDGIKLLHQSVQMSKNLDDIDKSNFFRSLVRRGLFQIFDYAFNVETDNSIRILSTDTIITIIEHDILLIQSVKYKNQNSSSGIYLNDNNDRNNNMSLLIILAKILLTDKSPGLREQVIQALYTLLHPEDCLGGENIMLTGSFNEEGHGINEMAMGGDFNCNMENKGDLLDQRFEEREMYGGKTEFQVIEYFESFYSKAAPMLFKPLILNEFMGNYSTGEQDLLLIHLVKLLTFISTEHDRRMSREFVLENSILDSISLMMKPTHMIQLRVAALKCFKTIISLDDTFYHRYMISKELYRPVIELLMEQMGNDNLVNSCLQDFFRIISKQCSAAKESDEDETLRSQPTYKRTNFILLNKHLLEKYGDTLQKAQNSIRFIKGMFEVRDDLLSVSNGDMSSEMNNSDNDVTMSTSQENELSKPMKRLHSHIDGSHEEYEKATDMITMKQASTTLSNTPSN
ncbi:hypothetical protein Kpol_400p4 [Vanderwaltozyma polyspora DSM 70294]|uniref:Serine/threonine-protein phosphatase 4 regulatory subunit 3 n=1 Tax=Vanderwaltozyma polyspora (strain ATCC 22028 / DSM 70294 / BCRC 21397 / CBS 2163 / NBRC 10782 / NRRL Y-8283 / UCD 57-17) TaxID=436907 RepID=A7TRU3_VANPO|nr:uncharacterized protein Kpol_400p4 [Vanderwaltozyma polyspora DSM 70294]EDO15010.1 hypothetical protein Kpol_400p4 [Vanderwaltozyma polyspora DSM 70294]